jgi:2'-5' RNA ligase
MSENALEVLNRLGCYEYLLILSPHADLHERIRKIKEKFAADYNMPFAAQSKAHVTLVKFITSKLMEEKISNRLHRIAMGIMPFKVELKDYGAFPTHTIFINVITKLPIQNLVREIKQAQSFMKVTKDFKPHFIEEPHLTISRKLKPWQFEKGWLEYSHLHFTGRFIADSMLWLKRPLTGGKYQILQRFEFENLPVTTKQGSLFM